jgi:hypothetical protein
MPMIVSDAVGVEHVRVVRVYHCVCPISYQTAVELIVLLSMFVPSRPLILTLSHRDYASDI